MSCGIYKIENKINGKVYIGQSVDIIRRWKDHRKYAKVSELPLYRAIRKYGIENFSFDIIEECSQKDLNEKEIYWINFYDSFNPDKGYNLTKGGQNSTGHFVKLNYCSLLEIKDLLKNSEMTLKEIGQKYGVSNIAIKDINQGHTWYDENEKYPLRQTGKKEHLCIDCGAKIYKGAMRCAKCASIAQRVYKRPSREELKQRIRKETFKGIGQQYGVAGGTISKWCKAYDLPYRKKDINNYSDEEWEKI